MPVAEIDEDKTIYKVVVNDEEQYSIWPAHREKQECLEYVKEVWTDMRPRSLREKMKANGYN
jgi:MbtH protein